MANDAKLSVGMGIDSRDFDKGIKSTKYQINKFRSEISGAASSVKKFVGGFAAISSASMIIGDAVSKTMSFEKSMSSLQALTESGAEGMMFFKSEAIKMSTETTKSAEEVVKAFQLIGGAKADLLQNKSALASVTKEALVLAEAAGVEVPEAAKALMMAMNQMGAKNSEARDYINILAAGAQEGAAEIPYLTQAIEKAGGVADTVGISFSELVSAIETIAPKVSDASSAGLYLRNIFLTLEKSADKNLRPSVVGLGVALDNLAKKQMTISELTDMFGAINVTAANALINSREEYDRLTKAVTGTNAAYEQQAIINDNLAGSVAKAASAYEALILSANKSNGFLKKTVDMFASILKGIREAHFVSKEEKEMRATNVQQESHNKSLDTRVSELQNFDVGGVKPYTDKNEAIKVLLDERVAYIDKIGKDYARELKKLNELEESAADYYKFSGGQKVSKKDITDQQELVNNLERKNKVYAAGTEYLKQQLGVSEQIVAIEEKSVQLAEQKASALMGSKNYYQEQIKSLNEQISATSGLDLNLIIRREKLQEELDKINRDERNFIELGIKLKPLNSDIISPTVSKDLDGLNKQLKSYVGTQTEANSQTFTSSQAFSTMATGMYDLSGVMNDSAAGWVQWGAKMIGTIAGALPSLASLSSANATVAVTGAAASAASIPFVGWMLVAGAVASVVAAMASIPKFANGGIVGGNSFAGDNVLARVNSGEMILNRGQQTQLWSMLNTSGSGGGDVRFVIRGTDLEGVLNNVNYKNSRR